MSDTPRTFAVAGRPRPHILALCDALERENAELRRLLRLASSVLCNHRCDGEYNNDDVIAVDDAINAALYQNRQDTPA